MAGHDTQKQNPRWGVEEVNLKIGRHPQQVFIACMACLRGSVGLWYGYAARSVRMHRRQKSCVTVSPMACIQAIHTAPRGSLALMVDGIGVCGACARMGCAVRVPERTRNERQAHEELRNPHGKHDVMVVNTTIKIPRLVYCAFAPKSAALTHRSRRQDNRCFYTQSTKSRVPGSALPAPKRQKKGRQRRCNFELE